jgi:hypothetical protein
VSKKIDVRECWNLGVDFLEFPSSILECGASLFGICDLIFGISPPFTLLFLRKSE